VQQKQEQDQLNLKQLVKSDNFCVMPFTHQYVTTTGRVNLCCIADYGNDLGAVSDLKEQWSSPEIVEVRKRMLANKPEPRCMLCYEQGKGSDRVSHNTRYAKQYPDLQLNAHTGNSMWHAPEWLDLRPGRLCNLKCRMCFSDVSSSIYDELKAHEHLIDIVADHPRVIADWLEDPIALESVKQLIPHVRVIKLAGGEPLFMPGVLKLLRWMVDNNHTDTHLDITTNGTRLQGKTFKLLEKFNHIDIQFSMCGTGQTNDYIRSGAEWKQLQSAYSSYINMSNCRVNIMATVQLYNIFNIHKLIDFWISKGQHGFMLFNIVNYPQALSIDLLDKRGRELASSTLAGFEKFFGTEARLAHIQDRLQQQPPDNLQQLRQQWVQRTCALDLVREESVSELHPILKEYTEQWA